MSEQNSNTRNTACVWSAVFAGMTLLLIAGIGTYLTLAGVNPVGVAATPHPAVVVVQQPCCCTTCPSAAKVAKTTPRKAAKKPAKKGCAKGKDIPTAHVRPVSPVVPVVEGTASTPRNADILDGISVPPEIQKEKARGVQTRVVDTQSQQVVSGGYAYYATPSVAYYQPATVVYADSHQHSGQQFRFPRIQRTSSPPSNGSGAQQPSGGGAVNPAP